MKKVSCILLILFLLGVFFTFIAVKPSHAQLIVIGGKYTVTKVDVPKRRLEALNYKKKSGIVYVLIRNNTQVVQNGNSVPWTKIKVGDIITIYGGLTWDIKIKAKKIILP